MPKAYKEITTTSFKNEYNIVKILTSVSDIMNFVKTQYKESKDSAVAFGYRKKPKVTLEDIMDEIKGIKTRLDNIDTRLDNIEENQTKDHNLLLKVIRLNNLKTE